MRPWLYDTLILDEDLQSDLGGVEGIKTRVIPRRSRGNILGPRPFLVFGLGNDTNEQLNDSTADDEDVVAHRQFFQIWVHDEGESFVKIDELVDKVKKSLTGEQSFSHQVVTIRWLETSQEFNNETYNTNFRYIRFQAIIAKGGTTS